MSRLPISRAALAAGSCLLIFLSGCVLTPRGTDAERQRLAAAGVDFERERAERPLPAMPPRPDWRDLLHRAFLANGDLEAAYFEWKAASARIDIEAGWPNTNLALGYEYMFSPGQMKAWDRSTIRVGVDPMQNLSLPQKAMEKGEVALDQMRATGKRFEALKFSLQRRIIEGWFDYVATSERLELARQDETLTGALAGAATARLEAGGMQLALVEADMAHTVAANNAKRLEAELAQKRARLNALAGLPPDSPLELPERTEPRVLAASDDALLALAVDNNPELGALAHEVEGREDALDFARLQYLPDINPAAAFTGSSIQVAGAMVVFSTQLPQIWAGIDEAKAMVRRSQAMLAQRRLETAAEYVAALYGLRDSERQTELLRAQLLPSAEMAQRAARLQYEAGAGDLSDLIQAERAPLEVRGMLADLAAMREARLAEMEELAGVDFETVDDGHAGRVAGRASEETGDVAAEVER